MQNTNQTIARFFSGTKALLVLAAVACAFQARSQIVTFDATTNSDMTTVECISPSGAVTGWYDIRLGPPPVHWLNYAFIRDLNGQTISFGPPTTNDVNPEGFGINSAGVVVGNYGKYGGQIPDGQGGTVSIYFDSSFLRLANGTIFNIDPTNAYSSDPLAINEAGTVGGVCYFASDGSAHFFLRSAQGTVTEFDPEVGEYPVALGLNNAGAVAGSYYDVDGNLHGFVRTAQGEITSFDEPDAVNGTVALVISETGVIAGYYYDANYAPHGFVLSAKGQFTSFDPVGSTGTYVNGINPAGVIAGTYTDANGNSHGFVRGNKGQIVPFDPPGAVDTYPASISPGGLVTGDYFDPSKPFNSVHGFLYQSNVN